MPRHHDGPTFSADGEAPETAGTIDLTDAGATIDNLAAVTGDAATTTVTALGAAAPESATAPERARPTAPMRDACPSASPDCPGIGTSRGIVNGGDWYECEVCGHGEVHGPTDA